jgi:hypothetical protein
MYYEKYKKYKSKYLNLLMKGGANSESIPEPITLKIAGNSNYEMNSEDTRIFNYYLYKSIKINNYQTSRQEYHCTITLVEKGWWPWPKYWMLAGIEIICNYCKPESITYEGTKFTNPIETRLYGFDLSDTVKTPIPKFKEFVETKIKENKNFKVFENLQITITPIKDNILKAILKITYKEKDKEIVFIDQEITYCKKGERNCNPDVITKWT